MPNLDKVKIAVGLHSHSKLDLSCDHVTTSNFMNLQPVYYRHMIPGEKISVNANAFTRLSPLVVPTFGRMRLNMRAFFVPFRVVQRNFTEQITDVIYNNYSSSSLVNKGPYITNNVLNAYFGTYGLTTTGASSSKYDVKKGTTYYLFNAHGRMAYKILRSLGYAWNWLSGSTTDDTEYSALPILALAKIYLDWYSLSQYTNSGSYNDVDKILKYDTANTPLALTSAQLKKILDMVAWVSYDGDYFTAAWDNPVAPDAGEGSVTFNFQDVTLPESGSTATSPSSNSSVQQHPTYGTPFATFGIDKTPMLSQYGIDSLKALTDYMRRHQLAGARAIDRYLADYGINLAADKLQRSIYLGNNSIDVNIGDVMSTANTGSGDTVTVVGDYAGAGYGNGSKTFDYETQEFGMFIICASVLPSGGYVQGFDRNLLHLTKSDFFNPDFDSLGVQAIAKGELYMSNAAGFFSPGGQLGIFGYVPRYAEYKVARDFLTGDFARNSYKGKDSWHLFRLFDDNNWTTEGSMVHNIAFCRGDDGLDYNRIFAYVGTEKDDSWDNFNIIYHFNVVSYCPCKSLFDTYDFKNNARTVTLDNNGVKMN